MKLSVLLLLVPLTAGAGNEVGNGGDVVVCRQTDGAVSTAEFFDVYEARVLRSLPMDFGADRSSLSEKVSEGFSRLGTFAPKREKKYREQFTSFFKEALFLKDVDLVDVDDSGHIFVPRGCRIEQLVIQVEPKFEGDPRYVVNKDYWDLLDSDSQASMILHEIIYREAILGGQENSIRSRYFNSMIFSNRISTLEQEKYLNLMERVGFSPDYAY